MELRSRELKLRLLSKSTISQKRFTIQIINIAAPVLLVIIAGIIYGTIRKKIYTRHLQ
jgi:ABC-2 type transport system permease protein